MYLAVADPLTSKLVLRDLEIVMLAALVIGLVFHGIRRRLFRQPVLDEGAPSPASVEKRRSGIDASHFTWWDFLVCLVVLSMFLLPLFFATPKDEEDGAKLPQIVQFISQVVLTGMLATMIIGMIQWVGMRSPTRIFGLNNIRFPGTIIWILIGASIAIYSVLWITNSTADYIESLLGELEIQAPVKSFRDAESRLSQITLILSAVVIAPLFEELLFRGYFYGILKKFTEPMFAACLSGGVFAIIHMNIPAILPLWFFGIFLALAYEASRSLWVPIGIHALFNTTSIIAIFLEKADPAEDAAATAATLLLPFTQ